MELRRPLIAITQARVGSTRLPAKVLREVAGRPLLWWHLMRLKQTHALDGIVVATTHEPRAGEIARVAGALGITVVHGSETDVLARFAAAAEAAQAATIIRVTSDCPLIDPALVDRLVDLFVAGQPGIAYAAIDVGRFPRGLDAEIFSRASLDRAAAEAGDAADREHVTPWIRRKAGPQSAYLAPDIPLPPHRWCVDTAEDLALVERVLTAVGERRPAAGWQDCAALIEAHPDWYRLNEAVNQKASS